MSNKIELYREFLEIEPQSKVFFPLAQLLVEQGAQDEAVVVLTKGIAFHPDYLEAKFFLIELLTRSGRQNEAAAIFASVGTMLSRYPSIWLLWAHELAAHSKDSSLAMLFVAHYFQNQSLTWAEVMERGLTGLPCDAPKAADPKLCADESSTVQVTATPAAPPNEKTVPLRGAQEVMELAELLEAPTAVAEKSKTRSSKGRDTAVRTKTMAALLAEQGDIAGALTIYRELLPTTPAGPEREEIESRIAALAPAGAATAAADAGESEKTADAAAAPKTSPVESEPTGKANGAAKLVNLLESLAGRLDARASS